MTDAEFSRLLLGLAVLTVACTVILTVAALRSRNPALYDRAFAQGILMFIAIGGALIGLAVLDVVVLSRDQIRVVIIGSYAAASVPGVVWVVQAMRGRFR